MKYFEIFKLSIIKGIKHLNFFMIYMGKSYNNSVIQVENLVNTLTYLPYQF